MAFTTITTTAGGDTVYSGMVKVQANFVDAQTQLDGKSATSHTHGAGGTVFTLVANDAALGAGATDGEMKVTVDSLDMHFWDAGGAAWYNRRRQTFEMPAAGMVPNATNGPASGTTEKATNDVNFDYLAFDATTSELACFSTVPPEDWDRSTIKAKFYWTSATGSTTGDTVEWGLKAKFARNDDAIDAAWGTGQVISDALTADNGADLQISGATPAITIGGTGAAGCMVDFCVYRNVSGTDDMTEDAWLRSVVIEYSVSGTTSQLAW